ncbi:MULTISPECIES: hypothetical protein [Rhizobium]|nr:MULTISPECIES: hypothetical protein [Rhizobium]
MQRLKIDLISLLNANEAHRRRLAASAITAASMMSFLFDFT